jgi:hypothetical protein
MPAPQALDVSALYRRCDPALLDFATTAELTDSAPTIVGQARAVEAVRFGIDIRRPGYNLFVLGEPGSGRHSAVRRLLEAKAAGEPAPSDWCYVYNFAESDQAAPAAGARRAAAAGCGTTCSGFVAELSKAIAAAFESEEYRARIEAIQEDPSRQREEMRPAPAGPGILENRASPCCAPRTASPSPP